MADSAYRLPTIKGRLNPQPSTQAVRPKFSTSQPPMTPAERVKQEWLAAHPKSGRGDVPYGHDQSASSPSDMGVGEDRRSIRSTESVSSIGSLTSETPGASQHSRVSRISSFSAQSRGSRHSGSSISTTISTASKLTAVSFLDKPFKATAEEKSPVLILSIDGAAVRGLVQLRVLQGLEEALRKELSDPTLKLTDVFDLFAGTSAGSLNVAALMTPENPIVGGQLDLPLVGGKIEPRYFLNGQTRNQKTGQMESLRDLAEKILNETFQSSHKKRLRDIRVLGGILGSKYSIKNLEAILQDMTVIGRTEKGEPLYATMADTVKPVVITTWDVNNREVINFNTYDACRDPMSSRANPNLWFSARASASAPTYFKPLALHDVVPNIVDGKKKGTKEIKRALIDAGLYVMSPTIVAWAEAMRIYPNRRYVILSIGGGLTTKARDVATEGNTAGSIPLIIKPAIESALEGQPQLMERALSMVPGIIYLRLNFEVTNSSFDDVSDKNLKSLETTADALIKRDDKGNYANKQFGMVVKTLVDAIKEQRHKNDKKPYEKCEFPEALQDQVTGYSSDNMVLNVRVIPADQKGTKERRVLEVETALNGQPTDPEVIDL